MNFVEQIFKRVNIQQIRSFLVCGAETLAVADISYSEREEKAWDVLRNILQELIADKEKRENVLDEIACCASELEHVYMEIGLQCGCMIAIQLLSENFN